MERISKNILFENWDFAGWRGALRPIAVLIGVLRAAVGSIQIYLQFSILVYSMVYSPLGVGKRIILARKIAYPIEGIASAGPGQLFGHFT